MCPNRKVQVIERWLGNCRESRAGQACRGRVIRVTTRRYILEVGSSAVTKMPIAPTTNLGRAHPMHTGCRINWVSSQEEDDGMRAREPNQRHRYAKVGQLSHRKPHHAITWGRQCVPMHDIYPESCESTSAIDGCTHDGLAPGHYYCACVSLVGNCFPCTVTGVCLHVGFESRSPAGGRRASRPTVSSEVQQTPSGGQTERKVPRLFDWICTSSLQLGGEGLAGRSADGIFSKASSRFQPPPRGLGFRK